MRSGLHVSRGIIYDYNQITFFFKYFCRLFDFCGKTPWLQTNEMKIFFVCVTDDTTVVIISLIMIRSVSCMVFVF